MWRWPPETWTDGGFSGTNLSGRGDGAFKEHCQSKAEKFALFLFGEFVETDYLEATGWVVRRCLREIEPSHHSQQSLTLT
jgi:hypothetical protein